VLQVLAMTWFPHCLNCSHFWLSSSNQSGCCRLWAITIPAGSARTLRCHGWIRLGEKAN
jgi:hypothetical protein